MLETDFLVPGLRLKLMAQSTVKSKLKSILLGYRRRRFLIIDRPVVSGAPVNMERGTKWLVSFLSRGCIFNFPTRVLGSSSQPVPLVFLEYPAEVDQTSLRQGRRIPVNMQALIESVEAEESGPAVPPAKGLVRDLSEGGCQVLCTTMFPEETRIKLTLMLSSENTLTNLIGEVKSHTDLGDRFLLGVSFAPGLTSDKYQVLHKYIQDLRAMPLRFEL